jgi:hypothetical protein
MNQQLKDAIEKKAREIYPEPKRSDYHTDTEYEYAFDYWQRADKQKAFIKGAEEVAGMMWDDSMIYEINVLARGCISWCSSEFDGAYFNEQLKEIFTSVKA